MAPFALPPNVLRHFYAGGERIAALRGLTLDSDHMPEEWIGAVNTTFGAADGRGLSRTQDGTLVRDAIAQDPEAWLGPDHVARYGDDPALLTKLLDAGQRLPVHFHPGRAFAREHLGLDHGKTEAWLIVEARSGASVWVGFNLDIALATVREWMHAQASDEMLAAMHELPVTPGDAIFVPAGTPHAIGAGALIAELQEPTDFSIVCEWEGYPIAAGDSHLGLGWDVALDALRLEPQEPGLGLPDSARAFFWADERAEPAGRFAVWIVLDGSGTIAGEPARRGDCFAVPAAADRIDVDGDLRVLRCLGPSTGV